MGSYAALFARRRSLVLGFVVLMTLVSVYGATRIEFDDVPRQLFANDDEEFARLLELYEDFGADDNDVLLVLEREEWFEPPAVELLRAAAAGAAAVPGVERVLWFGAVPTFEEGPLPRPVLGPRDTDLAAARERAMTHPLVGGRLLSEDGRVALVVARLDAELDGIERIEPPVLALRALAQDLEEDLAGAEPGARIRVTGIPTIRVDIFRVIRSEQIRFLILGGAFCLALALLLFRSLGAVVCTTLPPLVGALWAFGVIGLSGLRIDILGSVLTVLVIVIALTDSVHLMIDVRLSRARGASPLESAVSAVRHLGQPCALTSLTTAIGFGSLMLASLPAIRRFGLLAAMSVVMAFLAVITLMPLLSSVMPRVGASHARSEASAWERGARPVIRFLLRRARPVTIVGIAATLLLLVLSMRLEAENRLTEALPRGESYEALVRCEEAFGGVLPTYVVVEWSEELTVSSPEVRGALAEVSEHLRDVPRLVRPLSILDLAELLPAGASAVGSRAGLELLLALLPEPVTRRFVRPDLRRALVHSAVPDEGTEVMDPLFARVRADLREVERRHPGVSLSLTGTDLVARANLNRMIDDLARSLGFAVLVIFGVIAAEFRSLRMGAVSLLPNLFPLVLVGGTLRLLGMPLQMGSAVLFTVLLGLAVDDTIHFLARLRREDPGAGGHGRAAARLEAAFLAVGRAIAITTLILSVGFLSVSLSSVPTNRLFALFAGLGLFGALLGDLVLLPALLAWSSGRDNRARDRAA